MKSRSRTFAAIPKALRLAIGFLSFFAITPAQAQWVQINGNGATSCFAFSGKNIFAGTWGGGVYRSTNNGTSWDTANSGMHGMTWIYALAVSGANIFAGSDDAQGGAEVFRSTNNGTSWTAADSGILSENGVYALAVSGTNLFAGINRGGVFRSSNNGTSWTAVNNGLPDSSNVNALGVEVARLYTGELDAGEHSFKWDASGMLPGTYFVRVQGSSGSSTYKIVVTGQK